MHGFFTDSHLNFMIKLFRSNFNVSMWHKCNDDQKTSDHLFLQPIYCSIVTSNVNTPSGAFENGVYLMNSNYVSMWWHRWLENDNMVHQLWSMLDGVLWVEQHLLSSLTYACCENYSQSIWKSMGCNGSNTTMRQKAFLRP